MSEKLTEEAEELQENQKFRLRSVILDEDALFLRKESEPVVFQSGQLDEETQDLILALKTMVLEKDALGLAAVQLGKLQRVFVMRKPFNSFNILTVINPKIIHGGPKFSVRAEGCLSIDYLPDNIKGARVKRFSEVFVTYTDENGVEHNDEQFVGLDARVFQHEFAHLNGELMIDKGKYGKFEGMERAF